MAAGMTLVLLLAAVLLQAPLTLEIKKMNCPIHPDYDFFDHVLTCPICYGEQLDLIITYKGKPMTTSDLFECPKGFGPAYAWHCEQKRIATFDACKGCTAYKRFKPADAKGDTNPTIKRERGYKSPARTRGKPIKRTRGPVQVEAINKPVKRTRQRTMI